MDDIITGRFFVVASSIATILYIIGLKGISKKIKLIVIVGFIARIILVIIDVYVTRLPDAGTDDDGFYDSSVRIYESNYSIFPQSIYGEVYAKILSIIYYFIGSSRFSAQYTNVLFYAISAIIFLKALINFEVSKRYTLISMVLFCLMPNSLLMNSILRRETIMEFCVCVSLFFLSRWRKDPKFSYMIWTIVVMAMASLFHTAFIFGALIFTIYFALYDKNKRSVSFSISKMSKTLIILACTIAVMVGFLSMWRNKFSTMSDISDIYFATTRANGGSVYLEGYNVTNFGELILFTPLKLFYFLFSPVPWKFRGPMDVASFMVDSLIYGVIIFKIVKAKKNSVSRLLFASFMLLSVVFALGTFNSGTAIRHRFSLSPLLLISYSVVETKRIEDKNISKSKKLAITGFDATIRKGESS